MVRALVLLGLLLPTVAQARVTGSVGLGAVVGPIRWESPGVRLDDTVVGSALSLGAFVGQRVTPDVALGIALDATGIFPGLQLGPARFWPGVQVDMLVRLIVQPHIPGAVWRFSLGGAGSGFAPRDKEDGSAGVARSEFLFGAVAELSTGYSYRWNRQVAVSLKAAYLVSQHMHYIPVMLTLRWQLGAY